MPEAAEAQAAVDGEDGKSWSLPLPPLNATSLPEPYSPGEIPPHPFSSQLQSAAFMIFVEPA